MSRRFLLPTLVSLVVLSNAETIDVERDALWQTFPTYDPGAGNVSAECKRHSDVFAKELAKLTLWALKMHDASAKIPSGLLSGNVNQFGDFDECIGIEGKDGIQGQYCIAQLLLDVDQSRPDLKYLHRLLQSHYVFRSNITDPKHTLPTFNIIRWGLCTPASCTSEDVETSFQHTISRYTAQTGFKISAHVEKEMCQVRKELVLPRATIVTGLLFAATFVLSLVATYCDHYKMPVSELLLSLSLKRNTQKLFSLKRPPDDIASLHGIRFLHTALLFAAHKGVAILYNSYVNRTSMAESLSQPWTVISRAANLFTDTFIMMSGILVAYSFVNKMKKTGNMDVMNAYVSRVFRLLPAQAAIIFLCAYVATYVGSGPQWYLITTHSNICKQSWWRNLLFIQNYVEIKDMCSINTHHLAIDMQLFAISPLMVSLLYKKPRIGIVTLGIAAMISTLLKIDVTYSRDIIYFIHHGARIKQMSDAANYSYLFPSHRIVAYIMGILTGYFLKSAPKNFKLSATALYAGWTLCTMMLLLTVVGSSKMGSIDYVFSTMDAVAYNTCATFGWCTFFVWIIITAHTRSSNGFLIKLLSWRGFLVTTRLSYGIYLTQFLIFFYNVATARTPEYYGSPLYAVNLKEILSVILASIVLTLLIEMPFQNLRDYLFRKPLPRKDKTESVKVE